MSTQLNSIHPFHLHVCISTNYSCSLQLVGIVLLLTPQNTHPTVALLFSFDPTIIMADYILNATNLPQAVHPFYPLEANIVGYLANRWSVPTLLGIFAAGWVVILGITLALVRSHNPKLPSREKATILWFVLSACTSSYAPNVLLTSILLIVSSLP